MNVAVLRYVKYIPQAKLLWARKLAKDVLFGKLRFPKIICVREPVFAAYEIKNIADEGDRRDIWQIGKHKAVEI